MKKITRKWIKWVDVETDAPRIVEQGDVVDWDSIPPEQRASARSNLRVLGFREENGRLERA